MFRRVLKVAMVVAPVLGIVYSQIRLVSDVNDMVRYASPTRRSRPILSWVDALDVAIESYARTIRSLVSWILVIPQTLGALVYVTYVVVRTNIEELLQKSVG